MIFSAWWASGKKSPCPSVLPARSITRMVRVSTRPWPTERTRAASGTWDQGKALSRACSVFWLPLMRRDPVRAPGAQLGGQLAGGEAGVGGEYRVGQQAP